MSDPLVSYELRGKVAWIALDDGKANALSHAMIAELDAALTRAEGEAKAVVMAGRPGRFSAGFDLKVMASGPQAARDLVAAGGTLMMRAYEFPLPIVMAVTGHAIAGGVLLAATGDVRIGIEGEFKLGLNEVENKMPVPILAHELARDRLAPRALTEAVMHARLYSPDEAASVGWLDRVVAPNALAQTAHAEAERLAALTGPAYALTKASLRRQTIDHVRATMEENLRAFAPG